MSRKDFIENIGNELSYNSEFVVSELCQSIENKNQNFKPYNSSPEHYTLSIYEPLELSYTLLGYKNYCIRTNFSKQETITNKIILFYKSIGEIIEDAYDKKVIATKREIEYLFLSKCLNQVEIKLNRKIQLYVTQHVTEVTFDISNMKEIDAELLWGILEN